MSASEPIGVLDRASTIIGAPASLGSPAPRGKHALILGAATLCALLPLSIAASVSTVPPEADAAAAGHAPGAGAAGINTRTTLPSNVMDLPAAMAVAINARRGIDGRLETVAPFHFGGGRDDRANAVDCLAAAAWYEAGDDPGGQRAVVQVVLNRTRHPAYPKSVCDVVFQGSQRRTGCQFTFTCDGSLRRRPSPPAWTRARATARAAIDGAVDARVGTATHYHADYVLPYWADSLRKVSQIGAHIFYRWPGAWGSRRVLDDKVAGVERPMALLARRAAKPAPDEAEAALAVPAVLDAARDGVGTSPAPTIALPPAPQVPSSTIMTVANRQVGAGRWAVDAVDRCAGRESCLVLAYRDEGELARNRAADAARREAPLFLFVRDAASGMALALWDCSEVTRPGASQCLPQPGPALARLLRDRA